MFIGELLAGCVEFRLFSGRNYWIFEGCAGRDDGVMGGNLYFETIRNIKSQIFPGSDFDAPGGISPTP